MNIKSRNSISNLQSLISQNRRDLFTGVLLFAAALALYARTLAPGLLDGDEGEFQTNIYKLGVSHTGYPLFFLAAKLWTLIIPFGDVAYRANLFAAFLGALTVGAIYFFLRGLTGNRASAALAALLFAASRVEWSQAVIPRVYTLNAFFVVAVTALFFLWRAGKIDLSVPVFVYGLSLTNHRTMIWFAPAIALFVLWHERAALFRPRRLAQLAAAFLAPLCLYLYVFWRGESDVGVEFHFKDFNDMILGGNVRTWLKYGPLDWLAARVTDLYLPLLVEQFTPLGFGAGLLGMIALARNRAPRGWRTELPAREAFAFIALAHLGNAAFCLVFNTIDVEKFFIPSYLTFLFFVGVGIAVIGDWLMVIARNVIASEAKQSPSSRVETASPRRPLLAVTRTEQWFAPSALVLVGAMVVAFLVAQNFARNDWSARSDIAALWRENLSLPLEPNALIAGPWEALTPLEYLQAVENKRRDLERWKILTQKQYLGLVPYGSRQDEIERAVRAGRAVYLTVSPRETETLTALADHFRITRVGELWRVINLPPRVDAPQGTSLVTLRTRDGRALELVGYALAPAANLRAGDFLLITFFWRAPETPRARWTISLRIVDAADRVIAQRDAEPASGARPTIGWSANEVVQDDAGIFLPSAATPGLYRIQIVIYDSATAENLATRDGAIFTLAELRVSP